MTQTFNKKTLVVATAMALVGFSGAALADPAPVTGIVAVGDNFYLAGAAQDVIDATMPSVTNTKRVYVGAADNTIGDATAVIDLAKAGSDTGKTVFAGGHAKTKAADTGWVQLTVKDGSLASGLHAGGQAGVDNSAKDDLTATVKKATVVVDHVDVAGSVYGGGYTVKAISAR